MSFSEEEIRTQTHTEGRPGEDTGRRWHLPAQERDLRRHQPHQHPDLGLPASTVREYVAAVPVPQPVGLSYSSPS